MSTTRLYMKTTTIFLICLYSSLLHAESGKYDASKIVEPTPEMLKMTSAELFKEIDRDGDGQVSFTETNEALEYSPKHTKRKFAKSDRDKSGGLNLKEFEFRLTRTEWWNLSRETPEAMFKAADQNGNGIKSDPIHVIIDNSLSKPHPSEIKSISLFLLMNNLFDVEYYEKDNVIMPQSNFEFGVSYTFK